MNCPTCRHDMTVLGCRVSGAPFHWCPACGTIHTCDGNVAVPAFRPQVYARGSLAAAGLLDAFRGATQREVTPEEAAGMMTRTPIEAEVLRDGERLWILLLKADRHPPVIGEDKT